MLYTSLQDAYRSFNEEFFDSRLPQVLFTLQRKKGMAGYFHSKIFASRQDRGGCDPERLDEIALNPESISGRSDTYVLQVLLHEMVHVWQAYFGSPSRAGYHNQEFADRMESVGLIASTNGTQSGARVGQKMGDYISEGGPFSISAARLIKDGWTFTWEDVRGAREPSQIHVPVKLEGLDVTPVKDGHGIIRLVVTEVGEAPEPPRISPDIPAIPPADLPETIRALLPGPDTKPKHTVPVFYKGSPVTVKMNVPGKVKKVSRHKYMCPECTATAWAKPGTLLLCGTHEIEMSVIGVV